MKGTMVPILSASSTPPITPIPMPIRPINMPCTMKICMMLLGEAPSVRRMAMSACLSVTAITSVETILKAATSTMSDRMMNIIFFSIATTLK